MTIYVASSWRNTHQPRVIRLLRRAGHEVYDFRHPEPNDCGFAWSEIDPKWEEWSAGLFIRALSHPLAKVGFVNDWQAMQRADACVLVLPCGRSAHLEAGYFVGARKPLLIYYPEGVHVEPELMYRMAHGVFTSPSGILDMLDRIQTLRDFKGMPE